MQSPRNAGSLIGPHSFLMREARKLALVMRRWSYCRLFWTFCAGVSCDFPCGCALFGTGAACADAAARAVRATNVVVRMCISASFLEGNRHDLFRLTSKRRPSRFVTGMALDETPSDWQAPPWAPACRSPRSPCYQWLGTQCPQCQCPQRSIQWCRCQPQPQPSATSSIGGASSTETWLGGLGASGAA
jgi:hypothetical protein